MTYIMCEHGVNWQEARDPFASNKDPTMKTTLASALSCAALTLALPGARRQEGHMPRIPHRIPLIAVVALGLAGPATALEIQQVTEGVWALVGEMGQRNPDNLGNNATFGVVETPDGVVLIVPFG